MFDTFQSNTMLVEALRGWDIYHLGHNVKHKIDTRNRFSRLKALYCKAPNMIYGIKELVSRLFTKKVQPINISFKSVGPHEFQRW